jgi:uncharacterized membrane protein
LNSGESFPPDPQAPRAIKPFVAPARDLDPREPFRWLQLGWSDFRKTPALSLTWGVASTLLFAAVALGAWFLGRWILLISVLSGFIFIAPLLAFALYSVSRQLCLGEKPSLAQTLVAARKPFSNALVFALVLLVIFLLWARAGSMVHIFFPTDARPGFEGLFTFLVIGSVVGSVFALVTFAASAFSLPFIANREVDVVTAVVSSINAVMRNKWTMLCWVALIVLFTALGLVTALLGFIVIIPLLAYATWHAYRAALDVSGWATLSVGPGEQPGNC